MAPRKKNPLDDVAKTVGNWLGGAARAYADITDRSRDVQPERAARVQAALDATRAIGKVADAATGGFGAAVVSDAQRMAKTGSSTPSALYKTAAVNLAAGAVGAGAAQVAAKTAGKIASKVAAKRMDNVVVSLAPKNPENVFYHASPQDSITGILEKDRRILRSVGSVSNPEYVPVDLRPGQGTFHAGTVQAARDRWRGTVGMNTRGVIDRYEIVDPSKISNLKFVDKDNFGNRMAYPREQWAQTHIDTTPENKVITYINKFEDPGSKSVVIPKDLIRGKKPAVVYRGTADMTSQTENLASYTTGVRPPSPARTAKSLPAETDFFMEFTSPRIAQISQSLQRAQANIDRVTPGLRNTAAAAAALAPKKKSRGGGKNKK